MDYVNGASWFLGAIDTTPPPRHPRNGIVGPWSPSAPHYNPLRIRANYSTLHFDHLHPAIFSANDHSAPSGSSGSHEAVDMCRSLAPPPTGAIGKRALLHYFS